MTGSATDSNMSSWSASVANIFSKRNLYSSFLLLMKPSARSRGTLSAIVSPASLLSTSKICAHKKMQHNCHLFFVVVWGRNCFLLLLLQLRIFSPWSASSDRRSELSDWPCCWWRWRWRLWCCRLTTYSYYSSTLNQFNWRSSLS